MADQSSDVNLISPDIYYLLQPIQDLKTQIVSSAVIFGSINDQNSLKCDTEVTCEIQLSIRQGTKLMLRNIEWYVPINSIEQVIIGRKVLEAIEYDNKKLLLAAASDNSGGVFDMNQVLPYKLKEKHELCGSYKLH